jgi:hypothetical protein
MLVEHTVAVVAAPVKVTVQAQALPALLFLNTKE